MPGRTHRTLHTLISVVMLLHIGLAARPHTAVYATTAPAQPAPAAPNAANPASSAAWQTLAANTVAAQLAHPEPDPVAIGAPLPPGTLPNPQPPAWRHAYLPLVTNHSRGANTAVERLDLRTRYTKTFQRPDGSGYALSYLTPVHFQTRDGAWHDIDTILLDNIAGLDPAHTPASILSTGTRSDNRDAYVQSGYPTTPPGNQFNLYLGYDTWYAKGRTRIYARFNSPNLPSGTVINSARAYFYQYATQASSTYNVRTCRIAQDWGEYTITWNNQPNVTACQSYVGTSASVGWKYWTITTYARDWQSGAASNYGILLQAQNESAPGGVYYSRDCVSQCPGTERPYMWLDYTLSPVLNVYEGVNLSPGYTVEAGTTVAATFRVRNSGGAAFNGRLRIDTNNGGPDFPEQTVAIAANGGTVLYQQSRTFNTLGDYQLCAQSYDTSWRNLAASGSGRTCVNLTVVAPADVRLSQPLALSPTELDHNGGQVSAAFAAQNYGGFVSNETFRVSVSDGTPYATQSATLQPGDAHAYSAVRGFSQPGIYQLSAQHNDGSGWVNLIDQYISGSGSGFVRVLAPPPPPLKEEKGHPPSSGYAGEPVNTATGNYFYTVVDLADPTPGLSLQVNRWYNALDAADVQGPFGYGTSWEYGAFVAWRPDKSAVVHMGDGHQIYFLGSPDPADPASLAGIYASQGEDVATLERLPNGAGTLTFPDQRVYHVDANGRLQRITSPEPAEITLFYDGNGRLSQVAHSAGVTYTLSYAGSYVGAVQSSSGRSVAYTYDAAGNLTAVTRPDGAVYTYTYDANHRLTAGYDPNSHAYVENVYDAQGRVARQYDQTGQESVFTYDGGGSAVQTYTDALGHTITHTYDSRYNLIAETNALGYTRVYTRNAQGLVTAMRDENGQLWLYAYDAQGSLLAETDPLGNAWSYTYDARGNRTAQTNPLGHTWTYTYDNRDQLIQVTDPISNTRLYGYDAQGNMVWEQDETGAVTSYAYNALGLQTVITDALGHVTRMEYDAYGNQTRYVDANGRIAQFAYDAANRLVASIDPLGTVITFTYDAMGNLLTESNGLGAVKTYAYDAHDRLIAETDFNGHTTQYGYDALGRLTVVTDTLGYATRYTYDAAGNLVALQEKDGSVTTYRYDAAGNLTFEIDALNRTTRYFYDAAGRLFQTRRPCDVCSSSSNWAVTRLVLDAAGQVIRETDPRGALTRYAYDPLGRVATMRDALNNPTTYTYDPAGRLLQQVDPAGAISRYAHDALGQVITTTNPLGYQSFSAYDAVGNLVQVVNGRGYTTTYTYDANDRLLTTTDALGHVTTHAYDAAGNLTATTNPLGHTTTFTYDANGNQTGVTDPRGAASFVAYDALNRPIRRTDALGHSSHTGYDARGRVISETNALGDTRIYTYDVVGRRTAVQSPLGAVTTFTYDSADNQIARQDAAGAVWRYAYDANGNQIRQIDPLGGVWETTYDLLNRAVLAVDPLGAATASSYDAAGRLLRQVDPRGAVTAFVYDAAGQRTQESDALGHVTIYTYDANGNRLTLQDARGFVTRSVYDALDRPIAQVDALDQTRYTLYDAAGQVLAEVDYNGAATAYTYDANGNQTHVTDALGHVTHSTYDALNRVVAVADPLGRTRTRAYDALGQLVSSTTAAGHTTHYAYDADGHQIALTNPLGDVWTTAYDALGQPILQTDPLGRAQATAYDALGRVITATDALQRATAFAYDPLGRLLAVTGPDGTTQQYQYDPVGNLLSERDGNGHLTRYQYDLLNRLQRKIDPLGHSWVYQYDANGNQTGLYTPNFDLITQTYDPLNRLAAKAVNGAPTLALAYDANGSRTVMTDTLGVTTYQYDALNRLTASSDPAGRTVQYAYDAAGQQTSLTYPDGAVAAYAYDADGELAAITAPDGAVTGYTRDALGRPTRVTQGNGVTVATTYDAVGNTLSIVQTAVSNTLIAQHTYTVDAADRRVQLVETLPQGTFTTTYAYDALDRLTASSATDGRETHYTFDAAGNRLTMAGVRLENGAPHTYTVAYSYNAANQLLQAADSAHGVTTYTYDAAGSRTAQAAADVRHSYRYDAESRLIEARVEAWDGAAWAPRQGVYEAYAYDGNGRRVAKATFSATSGQLITEKAYRYDDLSEWHVLQTFDANNTRFLYDDYLHKLAYWQAGSAGYLQNDGLGSVLGATTAAGALENPAALMRYADYGAELAAPDILTTEDGYTGYEVDAYTGLDYGRNRYYDAAVGTFVTLDPYPASYEVLGNLHRYLYTQANPINYTDPLGLFNWSTGQIEWGDTLWSIAIQAGISLEEILAANPQIQNSNRIYAGDYLRIPECRSAKCEQRRSVYITQVSGTAASTCGTKPPPNSPAPQIPTDPINSGNSNNGGTQTPPPSDKLNFNPNSSKVRFLSNLFKKFAGVELAFSPYDVLTTWPTLKGRKLFNYDLTPAPLKNLKAIGNKFSVFARAGGELQYRPKDILRGANISIGSSFSAELCIQGDVWGEVGLTIPLHAVVSFDIYGTAEAEVKGCLEYQYNSGFSVSVEANAYGGLGGRLYANLDIGAAGARVGVRVEAKLKASWNSADGARPLSAKLEAAPFYGLKYWPRCKNWCDTDLFEFSKDDIPIPWPK